MLSKNNNNNNYTDKNYISNDLCKFIKYFIDKHNKNVDIDSLNQYLNNDGDIFYDLIKSILDVIGPLKDDILDNLKYLLKEKNIVINNDNEKKEEEEDALNLKKIEVKKI